MMKKYITLGFATFLLLSFHIRAQDIIVQKRGVEFPDGKLQTAAWQGNDVTNPTSGNVVIYAEISGINGDVVTDGYQNHTEFFNLNFLLRSSFGGPQNLPIGDPVNKYFEVYKQIDDASVDLLEKFNMGQKIDEIKFKFVLLSGNITELYRITSSSVDIVNFEMAYQYVEGGNPIIFEKYTLYVGEIDYENLMVPEGVNMIISGNE